MQREAFIVASPSHRALRPLNYAPAVEALRHGRAASGSSSTGRLVAELGPGYATVFARVDAAREHGVELLSQSDMFAAEPAGRWIRKDSMARPERHEVHRWQILIAGAGTLGENELYGRPVIADARLVGKYVGQDTLSLRFDPPGSDLNLYAYAFLASPTGLKALRSTSYGTKILRLRKDLVAELPIPLASKTVVGRVAALVRRAVDERERYADRLALARSVIRSLPEMQLAEEMCSVRRAHTILWDGPLPTLRAWAFASSGGALGALRKAWTGRLGDVIQTNGLFHGLLRQRTPCSPPHGIALYSQRDVFGIRRLPRHIAHPGCDDAALFVPPMSLLIASRGQLSEGALFGRVALGDTFAPRSAVTQDILRLLPQPAMLGATYAYLNTHVGQTLLRSAAAGTSIPILRIDLVRDLPFPALDGHAVQTTSDAVSIAIRSRIAADAAEAEAIRIIEEEVLPQWLA